MFEMIDVEMHGWIHHYGAVLQHLSLWPEAFDFQDPQKPLTSLT